MLEGRCRLAVDGEPEITLEAGDFVLLPATPAFTMSGFEPVTPTLIDPDLKPAPGDEVRHGDQNGEPDVRLLGGYFVFDSPDAGAARVIAAGDRAHARRRAPGDPRRGSSGTKRSRSGPGASSC